MAEFPQDPAILADIKVWQKYAACIFVESNRMVKQADAVRLSVSALSVTSEVKTLVDRLDTTKLEEILRLGHRDQNRLIESFYPIHELQADHQL